MTARGGDARISDAAGLLLGWLASAEGTLVADVVSAFARAHVPGVGGQIAPLARHEAGEVRVAVAQALHELGDDSPSAVAALVALTRDPLVEVRSWATFALSSEPFDGTAATTDALAARLEDPCSEVRVEAVRGLARRGDPRAIDTAFELAPGWAGHPVFRQAIETLRAE